MGCIIVEVGVDIKIKLIVDGVEFYSKESFNSVRDAQKYLFNHSYLFKVYMEDEYGEQQM